MTSLHPLDALRTAPGAKRPRRLRRTAALRDLVRETTLEPSDVVQPLFVVPGEGIRNPISSMPGVEQLSVDLLGGEARELAALGVQAVLLFGIPSAKDPHGSESFAEDGVVQQRDPGAEGREPGARRRDATSACASTPNTATADCSTPMGTC